MITPHPMRRLAALSLLALSLTTFSPAGLSLVSAAGEKDASNKNTGQAAKPDTGGNRGEQKGDLSGVKAGESHSNDDHTKAAPGQLQPVGPKAPDDGDKADDASKAKDVDSPGCAFGNDQKNGQLATAPGCTKAADGDQPKTKGDGADLAANQPVVTPSDTDARPVTTTVQPPAVTPDQPITVVVVPTADQPVVATPGQPVNVVLDAAITTPSGQIIPAGSTVTILVGSVPLTGLVEGATISAANVAAFSAPPFMADVAGVTIQQAPDSQLAAAEVPSSLPSTGGGYGKLQQ